MIIPLKGIVKYFLDKALLFLILVSENWGIVQWQDGRLWICLSGFESLSPSQEKQSFGSWITVSGLGAAG
jgi:hypothetical protein